MALLLFLVTLALLTHDANSHREDAVDEVDCSDDSIMLLDIPRWDFHWQDRYQFVEPVKVNFGNVLRMSCGWDNSLSDDPRYVVWGEGTSDEMCFGTVMIKKP